VAKQFHLTKSIVPKSAGGMVRKSQVQAVECPTHAAVMNKMPVDKPVRLSTKQNFLINPNCKIAVE